MAVRIGIDVGGTFTDAVAIDDSTFELIGTEKVPTTHSSENGVADGIVQVLTHVMEKYNIKAENVTFIAHGTTQATNALLEGDVEYVGVVGVGKGIEGYKVKLDTEIGDIELAPNKFLKTKHYFISQDAQQDTQVKECIADMLNENIHVAVVSAAYSVDDPTDENEVMAAIREENIAGTCSHEISKLYGLRMRTRTAVINASILPKMIQTANMTERSVIAANIKAPLMIMRCDGGVMSVNEIRKRPILTMLSGPAAGVAGALMYEKVSEGIFLEVGGTSTDISAIHNGQVMVSYAEVGGHKTYVNSLDVRTVAIAGGSMIRIGKSGIVDIGPRSAHIANLSYVVYTKPEDLGELEIRTICPCAGDFDDYCAVYDKTNDKMYALTLACTANASGHVKDEHYAKGYKESAEKAFAALEQYLGIPREDLISQIHHKAAEKNKGIVTRLIQEYGLHPNQTVLVGGGGGAAAVVPYLAEEMGLKYRIAKNAEVISPIGVALALVRDVVERTIANPTQEDILSIRKEAEQLAMKSGAAPETIEVFVEVDGKNNTVRAIATGATELKAKNRTENLTPEKMLEAVKNTMPESVWESIQIGAQNDHFTVYQAVEQKKKFFGLLTSRKKLLRVVNAEGLIRVQSNNGAMMTSTVARCLSDTDNFIAAKTEYTDGGETMPTSYILVGARLLDLSKLATREQIVSLLKLEVVGLDPNEPVIIVLDLKQPG